MKRGRPIKYDNDNDRKQAIKESKTRYMLNKQWTCDICQYTANLASKWMHMKSKKHITNTILEAIEADDRFELINDDESI